MVAAACFGVSTLLVEAPLEKAEYTVSLILIVFAHVRNNIQNMKYKNILTILLNNILLIILIGITVEQTKLCAISR